MKHMNRKYRVLIVLLSAIITISCLSNPIDLKNTKRVMIGIFFVNIKCPEGWSVDYTESFKMKHGQLTICNNKNIESGKRVEFRITDRPGNTDVNPIPKDLYGYQKLENGIITYEFAKKEYFWSLDKNKSSMYGVIKKHGIAFYDIEFAYLPDDEITPEVNAILMNMDIE